MSKHLAGCVKNYVKSYELKLHGAWRMGHGA
jgi:hypothetical protein